MVNWIVALIIISTVLACWSFSLFLRLVSEFVARKRKRLHTEYQRKGVVWALVAMLLGLFGAVVSAWFAFDIAQQTSGIALDDVGIVFAIAVGLSLFALMLIVWASIGDRARGRLRCPRCWYDMEGIDTPQCPECGKAIKNPKNLRKARRTNWPFVLASVCIGVAVYGFANNQRVGETDRLALVPTWVLMMGWEVLPEDWILEENSSYTATLEYRLRGGYGEHEDWVSDTKMHRFNVRLYSGMLDGADARWDPRRLTLIHRMTPMLPYVWIDSEWFTTERVRAKHIPIDARRLLRLTCEDVLDAINAETPNELQSRIMLSSPIGSWINQTTTPTELAPLLLTRNIEEEIQTFEGRFVDLDAETRARIITERDEYAEFVLREVLDPLAANLDTARFRDALLSSDENLQLNALYVLDLTGRLPEFVDVLLSTKRGPGLSTLSARGSYLGVFTQGLRAHETDRIFAQLEAMLAAEDCDEQNHAAYALMFIQRSGQRQGKMETLRSLGTYQTCITYVFDRFIGHDEPIYPDEPNQHWSRNTLALQIIANHDATGEIAYPLLKKHLLNDTNTDDDMIWLNLSDDPDAPTKHIGPWVEHFASLATSEKGVARRWVIENLPVQRGTVHDKALDSIVLKLLDDEDKSISYFAQQKFEKREIPKSSSHED